MAFRFDPSAGLPSSSEDEQEDTGLRATNSRGDKGLASSSHVREQSGQSVKAAPSASKGDQLKVNGNLTATGKAKKSNFEKYLEDEASQFKDEDVSTSGIKEEKQGLRQQIISPLDEDPPPQGSLQWTRQEELGVMDLYQLDDLNPQEWSEFAISTLVLESKDKPSETDLEADNNNLAPSEKRIHFEMDNPAHASLFHIAEELQDEDDPLDIIMKDSTRAAKRQTVPLHKTISDMSVNHRAVSLSSRSFDPKLFLLEVHGSTSFSDLMRGADNLKRNISHRQDLSRKLVKQNFYRFVTAKSLVDLVYKDMKSSIFSKKAYGTYETDEYVKKSLTSSRKVFEPILNCSRKAETIRTQLAYIDRYRFVFNLPTILKDALKKQNFNIIVRDYQRGKTLIKEYGDKKIFTLIWKEAEKVAVEARNIIQTKLQDPNLPLEIQERNIGFLMKLGYAKDPTVIYLKTQQDHIIHLMSTIFERQKTQMDEILKSWIKMSSKDEFKIRDGQSLTSNLKTMLIEATTNNVEKTVGSQLDHKLWILKINNLKEIISVFTKKLPDFMKIATSSLVSDSKVVSNFKDDPIEPMFHEIVSKFNGIIKDLFPFNGGKSDDEKVSQIIKLLLKQPLNAPYYSLEILSTIVDAFNELKLMKIPGSVLNSLAEMISQVKIQLIQIINQSILDESKIFRIHENWTCDPEFPEGTFCMRLFYRFLKYSLRSNYIIFTTKIVIPGKGPATTSKTIGVSELAETIQTAFKDSLTSFIDGLYVLGLHFHENMRDQIERGILTGDLAVGKSYEDIVFETHSGSKVSILDATNRYLVLISNIQYFRSTLVEKLLHLFKDMFHGASSVKSLTAISDHLVKLENALILRYLEPIQERFVKKIEDGLLSSTYGLVTMTSAGDVRGKVYEILLDIVVLHAQIQDICPRLLKDLISRICMTFFSAYLCCLEQPGFLGASAPSKLGLGGYVQLMTELAFIEHTLKEYMNNPSQNHESGVTGAVAQKHQRHHCLTDDGLDAAMKLKQVESRLSNLSSENYVGIPNAGKSWFREGLENARKASENQFLCFASNAT